MRKRFLINLHLSSLDWFPAVINMKNKNFSVINESFTEDNIDDFNVIIPLNIPAIESIKNLKDVNENKIILCPSDDILITFYDKKLFSDFMNVHFKEYIPETVYNINSFPYLAKHKYGVFGELIFYIETIEDYVKHEINEDFLLQRYVKNNNDITGQFFVYKGKVISKFFYKQNTSGDYNIHKGKLINYEKIDFKNDVVMTEIFRIIEYTGFACVDFTEVNGKVFIYEINPRVGGTFMNNQEDFDIMFDIIYDFFNCTID